MNIETYIITWSREDLIHLTINYYKQFSKVILFDNFSTDRTREIAEELGAEVRLFGKAGVLDDGEYLKVKNNAWKGSKADYVIVCDDDEILYHPDLLNHLYFSRSNRVTIFKTQGYNMFSNDVPRESFLEIKTGLKNDNYSKWVIFDPKNIKEIGYVYGCHEARPKGELIWGDGLKVLHYRDIGGIERLIKRHRDYVERLSPLNQKWNLGHHYKQSEEEKRREWKDSYERSETLF